MVGGRWQFDNSIQWRKCNFYELCMVSRWKRPLLPADRLVLLPHRAECNFDLQLILWVNFQTFSGHWRVLVGTECCSIYTENFQSKASIRSTPNKLPFSSYPMVHEKHILWSTRWLLSRLFIFVLKIWNIRLHARPHGLNGYVNTE